MFCYTSSFNLKIILKIIIPDASPNSVCVATNFLIKLYGIDIFFKFTFC